jgi:methionyl-tRNA synthetase
VRDEAYYGEDEIEEREGKRYSLKTNTPVEWVEEESYFFKLSAYAKPLLEHYEKHPDFITPEQYRNEIVAFVRARPQRPLHEPHHLRLGHPRAGQSQARDVCLGRCADQLHHLHGFPDANAPKAAFWPADAHVIGKDITRFHAIYWPAFLMSAGWPVPKQVVVHGFLFNRGEKMSKSVGNIVSPSDLVRATALTRRALLLHARSALWLRTAPTATRPSSTG